MHDDSPRRRSSTKRHVVKHMWMMRSSCGQLAPFYGCAFTRERLLADISARSLKANHATPVRVAVTMIGSHP